MINYNYILAILSVVHGRVDPPDGVAQRQGGADQQAPHLGQRRADRDAHREARDCRQSTGEEEEGDDFEICKE